MDINNHMYLWIDTIVKENQDGNGIIMDGDAYDDELGFGADKRRYEGKFVQVSKEGRIEGNGRIDMVHYLHKGLMWNASNISLALKPPFVITDNLRLRHVFSGYILLTPSINAEEVFARYLGHNLAILSEHCIGSIHVNQKDTYLHVFSDNNYLKCLDILQEDFCFAGYTDNIGRMEFIGTAGSNG